MQRGACCLFLCLPQEEVGTKVSLRTASMTPPPSARFNGQSHRFSIRSTCWFILGVKYQRSALCADSPDKGGVLQS